MLCKKLAKGVSCCFLAFLLLYLTLFLFFNDNFETRLEESFKNKSYSAYYINLFNKNNKLALNQNDLKELILQKKSDIYIIRSKEKLNDLKIKDYHIYTQTLSSTLTIISRYKLSKNKVIFKNDFFNPVFVGYIKFPNKRVLFSFLSTSFLPDAFESKKFRKYLMLRRVFTEFRNKKLPILFFANWDINFLTLRRWLHYLQIKPQNHIYDLQVSSDDIQVLKSTDAIKVHSVIRDNLLGVRIDFSLININ